MQINIWLTRNLISHRVSQFISIFVQLFKYTQLKQKVLCKLKVSVLQATVYSAESILNILEEEAM